MKHLVRELPPVHAFKKSEQFSKLIETTGLTESRVITVIQHVISDLREQLLTGTSPIENPSKDSFFDYIITRTEDSVHKRQEDFLTPVINGTGTVLHTNLGRARLSSDAIAHVAAIAGSYSNLEYNIDEGKRGSRHDILEELLIEVTGAEAAMVVNNNAAAVYLILRALAKDKEVIVSRGQLVEIGGSFRISSIMEESGANLVEVGTTNKTHLYDYQNAISEHTGMLLKVHTSNFKMVGFTESVQTEALVALKNQHEGLIFYEDLGSGSIYDFRKDGIGEESVVSEVIQAGVDLVSFSGDKLLGGPQAGIIVGKKELINRLKKHQLARVLRVDKMTFAGLEKTLRAYLTSEEATRKLPTVRDITKPLSEIENQANAFITALTEVDTGYQCYIKESTSQIGGGTMPDVELPTYVVSLTHETYSENELAEKLRLGTPAIITRIQEEQVMLDFRTISIDEMPELVQAFLEANR